MRYLLSAKAELLQLNRSQFSSLGIFVKVPILKECHFGKMKLWRVEHFWTLFVFTFGRDCYCIQQSHPKVKTNMLWKCSTRQSFIFPKWHSFKIGTLVANRTSSELTKLKCKLTRKWKGKVVDETPLGMCNFVEMYIRLGHDPS